MITNKDIRVENGNLVLNGDKYPLDGQSPEAIMAIYSVMGQMGAKNLIPYPYANDSITDHGVTFTVNNDGTVIANGTANGTAQLHLVLGNVSLSAAGNLVIDTNKPLFLSGCPSGGSHSTFRIQYGLTDGTTYWAKTASDTGSGVEITPVDGLNTYCFVVIKIMVFEGYTANNLTFKPMLRLAADTDDTYQPYAKTNRQLTEDVDNKFANLPTAMASGKAQFPAAAIGDQDIEVQFPAGTFTSAPVVTATMSDTTPFNVGSYMEADLYVYNVTKDSFFIRGKRKNASYEWYANWIAVQM